MSEGDTNRDIWLRLGQVEGRMDAVERGQQRIESRLGGIEDALRNIGSRLDRGAGFWAAVVVAASVVGSVVGGAVWVAAQADVGPFDSAEEVIEERVE